MRPRWIRWAWAWWALAAALPLPAATITVCASGCAQRSVQAAIQAAQPGDIVELKAGERFTEAVTVPAGKSLLTIRSSRWKELPAAGYRIRPVEDAALLATIVSSNPEPALQVGSEQNAIVPNGVDLANNRIRFDYAAPHSTLYNGAAVACYVREEFLGRLPSPLVAGRKYWVRDWDAASRSGRLAESAGGPPVRLADVGSAAEAYFYARPACTLWDQPRDITVEGLRLESVPGKTRVVVLVGHNAEADPVQMGPLRIRLRHLVVTGIPEDPVAPLICVALFGGHQLTLADSWLGHCKAYGEESKGLGIQNVRGAWVTNNYIAGASINLLTGGSDAARGEVNQDIIITGNFIEKPGYLMYREGTGEPTGPCYYGGGSGMFYRRTDLTPNTCANGACYTCTPANTWRRDPGAFYRNQSYVNKNLLELKDCEHCLIQGNLMRGSFAGPDPGQGWCFGVSVGVSRPGVSGFGSPYHRAHHIAFRDNHGDYCYSGIVAGNSAYEATFRETPIAGLVIENNLLTNFGWFPAMSQHAQHGTVNRYGLKQSGGNERVRIANNTIRGRPEGSFTGVIFYDGKHEPHQMRDFHLLNNIFHYHDYALHVDSRSGECTPAGLLGLIPPSGPAKHLQHNVFYAGVLKSTLLDSATCQATIAGRNFTVPDDEAVGFVSATDSRLKPTSPFSSDNKKARALSGDGTSLGADIDLIEQSTLAAQQGTPPPQAQIGLEVRTGSRHAMLRYQRPEGVSSCAVSVFTGPRRESALVPDTAKAALRADTRPSSLIQGRQVQFLVGAAQRLQPNQTYSYRIECGALRVIGRFGTLAEGATVPPLVRYFEHPTAQKVRIEYSPQPSFAPVQALPVQDLPGGKASLPVRLPAGPIYWRPVFIGPQGETAGTAELWVGPAL